MKVTLKMPVTGYPHTRDGLRCWMCRACMREGIDSEMKGYIIEDEIFLKCPQCKVKEKIGSFDYTNESDPLTKFVKKLFEKRIF